jgi:hypothetical protein
MHIAYRNIFKHTFKLSLRSHIKECLDDFGIQSVNDNICKIRKSFVRRNLSIPFHAKRMLMNYIVENE